jgi:hypothetical protein
MSIERRDVELRGRTGNGNSAHARFAKEDAKGAVVAS